MIRLRLQANASIELEQNLKWNNLDKSTFTFAIKTSIYVFTPFAF